MTKLYESCKKEWKEDYLKKEKTEKEFRSFIRNFDMCGKNDFVEFPISYRFRWKCPCCDSYLDIQKLKDGKVIHHQHTRLTDNIIFSCNECGYEYGYHYISGSMCNP